MVGISRNLKTFGSPDSWTWPHHYFINYYEIPSSKNCYTNHNVLVVLECIVRSSRQLMFDELAVFYTACFLFCVVSASLGHSRWLPTLKIYFTNWTNSLVIAKGHRSNVHMPLSNVCYSLIRWMLCILDEICFVCNLTVRQRRCIPRRTHGAWLRQNRSTCPILTVNTAVTAPRYCPLTIDLLKVFR